MHDDPSPPVVWDANEDDADAFHQHNNHARQDGGQAPKVVKKREAPGKDDSASVSSSAVAGAHDQLLYQREVLDAIFHHIPIGVVLMNAWGVMQGFSKGAERMFMYAAWEIVGENVRAVMPVSVAERHDYYLSRARQRITQRLATMLHVPEATIALDNLVFEDDEQAKRIGNDVLRMAMFGGQKREVLALDKTATSFPLEVAVSPVILTGVLYYLGYLVDVRDLTLFQDLTVKQELLLRSILDSRIMSRLLAGEHMINDRFDSASIGVIEIVDYSTKVVGLDDDQQRADFLREVFAILDRVVETSAIEKVKTMGCRFLIASGVPSARDEHAGNLFAAACAIMQAMHNFNDVLTGVKKNKDTRRKKKGAGDNVTSMNFLSALTPIELRIGIHTGPVIGGFYSQVKGQYDVYGATVLKAELLCQQCRPQYIHVSTETYGLLPPEMANVCEIRRDVGIPYTYETFYREETAE